MIRGFTAFGKGVTAVITIGLAAAIVETLTGLTLIPGLNPLSEGYETIGAIAIVLAGAFPLVFVITKIFRKPLLKLGKLMGMNDAAAAGLVATMANSIPMFGMVKDLLHTTNENDFNKLFSRIEKYENISDNMELEIANYLNNVSEGRLSSESKLEIRGMLREVTEIESIGDSCYNLARTVNRKRTGGNDFTEKQYEHIHQMMQLTENALKHMVAIVEDDAHVVDVNHSFNIENEMNNYRSQLKNQNILDVNNKEYDYQMGVHYMDLIGECEKLGDYVVNVVEARTNVKEKKTNENR
jgi:Na+/phosphate symporter